MLPFSLKPTKSKQTDVMRPTLTILNASIQRWTPLTSHTKCHFPVLAPQFFRQCFSKADKIIINASHTVQFWSAWRHEDCSIVHCFQLSMVSSGMEQFECVCNHAMLGDTRCYRVLPYSQEVTRQLHSLQSHSHCTLSALWDCILHTLFYCSQRTGKLSEQRSISCGRSSFTGV